ncbi:putative bifunctional diguanylate cyclase/phosphodiesterase [Sphingomonas sp.]|uniref:putative bifunctional diguanylate cyclase/phosphodiesterase n=1 Tax=Sphingomonas sp. TaxID=28214 RepID=UPI0035C86EAB
MRLSIAARVSIACGAVIVMAIMVLASGFAVSDAIVRAEARIVRLSETLHVLDRQDQAQQRLRLAIGEATRAAERGVALSPARWAALTREADAFARSAREALPLSAGDVNSAEAASMAETRNDARAFAAAATRLLVVARDRPSTIGTGLPPFVTALKALEVSRGRTRDALIRAIWQAAARNGRESQRNTLAVLLGGVAIAAIIAALSAWLRRRVLTPITQVAARLREFRAGGSDDDVPGLSRDDELGDLARGLFEYRRAVESRRAAERRADFLAHHDMLTGLANRLLFENRLAHELARSARTGDTVAVFAIDLDGMKAINDRLGHAGGDRALRRAGKLLSRCARGDDLVARVGGDEFAIIQVARAQPAAAEALLARIYKEAEAGDADDDEAALRMSVGVALSDAARSDAGQGDAGQSGERLYELADLALYRAKNDGRHTARFFNDRLKAEESLRLQLSRDLEQAIAGDQLWLAFQPIAQLDARPGVDARPDASRVTGYEALLRWHHPALGEIGAETLIPIAESTGLIAPIGQWVIERALAEASTWAPDLSVAINLSPLQFRAGDLAADIRRAAARHGIALERIELEVTESATLLEYQRDDVLATLKALQADGARVAMDDFGTGHSSLSNLKDFSFNKIKIDRSFVAAMRDHPPSASIVRAIIGLGKSLKLTIVAEGVETEQQLADLRRWGCDQVQGYLIGRPCAHVCTDGRPAAAAQRVG